MRFLVTGGSGFIGTNLVREIVHRDFDVLNLDNAAPRDAQLSEHWRQVDILDAGALTRTTRDWQPDVVIHLAARTDLHGRDLAAYAANVQGVTNMLNAVGRSPSVARLVVASSRMVCRIGYRPTGDEDYCPPNAYGESKVRTESLVRSSGLPCPWTIVRPTSIWGPWFGVPYRDFFDSVLKRRYVHPQGLRVMKHFGFVGNSVHQLLAIALAPAEAVASQTLYLADDPAIEVRAFADTIADAADVARPRELPLSYLRAVARAGDGLQRLGWAEPPLTSFRLENLLTPMLYDLAPMVEIAGPSPYRLNEAVGLTVDWMRGTVRAPSRRGRAMANVDLAAIPTQRSRTSPVRLDLFDKSQFRRGRGRVTEACWYAAKVVFFLSSIPWPNGLRASILRAFGARVGQGVVFRPRVNIHFPWKLSIGDNCWLGERCELLNLEPIVLGPQVAIAHDVYMAAAGHDISDPRMGYKNRAIVVRSGSWIATRAYVGPGVEVGQDAVVAAGAVVTKTVPPRAIVGGNPAVTIGVRTFAEGPPLATAGSRRE